TGSIANHETLDREPSAIQARPITHPIVHHLCPAPNVRPSMCARRRCPRRTLRACTPNQCSPTRELATNRLQLVANRFPTPSCRACTARLPSATAERTARTHGVSTPNEGRDTANQRRRIPHH